MKSASWVRRAAPCALAASPPMTTTSTPASARTPTMLSSPSASQGSFPTQLRPGSAHLPRQPHRRLEHLPALLRRPTEVLPQHRPVDVLLVSLDDRVRLDAVPAKYRGVVLGRLVPHGSSLPPSQKARMMRAWA